MQSLQGRDAKEAESKIREGDFKSEKNGGGRRVGWACALSPSPESYPSSRSFNSAKRAEVHRGREGDAKEVVGKGRGVVVGRRPREGVNPMELFGVIVCRASLAPEVPPWEVVGVGRGSGSGEAPPRG